MNDYMNELLSVSQVPRSSRIDWGGGSKRKGRRQRRKGVPPGCPGSARLGSSCVLGAGREEGATMTEDQRGAVRGGCFKICLGGGLPGGSSVVSASSAAHSLCPASKLGEGGGRRLKPSHSGSGLFTNSKSSWVVTQ